MARTGDFARLTYLLSLYPVARETFVTGEIANVASVMRNVSIRALKRSGEADLRPGGIPNWVDVAWVPSTTTRRWWAGNGAQLRTQPSQYFSLLANSVTRGPSLSQAARSAYLMTRAAALAGEQFDATSHVHAHFATRAAVAARSVAALTGASYSVTVHAYDIFTPNPWLETIVRTATLIVSISEFDRNYLLNRFADVRDLEARLVVIHVGVPALDLAKIRAEQVDLRSAHPLQIVVVARLVEKKGIDVLIDAVAEVVRRGIDLRCKIVGGGPDEADLRIRAERTQAAHCFEFTGPLLPQEARLEIARADMFVLPCVQARNGDQDGIPVALMEAMASGTPVISTDLSGIPELISDGMSGLLAPPRDVKKLADLIQTLAANPALRDRLANGGKRVIAKEFDQQTNAMALLTAISSARRAISLSAR